MFSFIVVQRGNNNKMNKSSASRNQVGDSLLLVLPILQNAFPL
jgi:hypothetical protein